MTANPQRDYRLSIDLRNVILVLVAILVSVVMIIVLELAARARFRPELTIAAVESAQRVLPLRERPPNADLMLDLVPTPGVIEAGMRVGDYALSVDSLGFIEPSGDVADTNAYRLLFLGGSTTECAYIEPEKRFPYAVARLLTDSMGVPAAAFNAGRSGNNSLHSLVNLIGKGLPIRPDVVIVMENINDLVRLAYFGTYAGMNSSDDLPGRGSMTVLHRSPPDVSSAMAALVARVFPGMAFGIHRLKERGSGTADDEFAGAVSRGIAVDTAAIARDYRAMLRSIVAVSRAHDAVPVIMTQPARFPSRLSDDPALAAFWLEHRKGVDYESFVRAHAHLNDVARSVAAMDGVFLVDLASEFRPSRTNMYDIVHVSAEGSMQEANIIARELHRGNFHARPERGR